MSDWWSNMWESDEQAARRHEKDRDAANAATAQNSANAAAAQKQQFQDAALNFKGTEFKFDPNNPELTALKKSLAYSSENAKENTAQQIAQRGMSNSGAALRANARTDQQLGNNIADVTGRSWQTQLAQNTQANQTAFSQTMAKFGVANDVYQQAQNEYYNQLTIQTQDTMFEYQKGQDKVNNVINAIGAAGSLMSGVGAMAKGFK